VSEPRISAFARLANGNARPTRVIAGQTARVSRTMHGIFYDPTHDEIVVPVALGGAVLTLPGGADGGAPPLRVLQGAKTGLVQPDTLYVDVPHDEMIVDSGDDSVLVFNRTASGDVPPIRKLGGPKTRIRNIYGMTVDSLHNLIVIANRVDTGGRESEDGILIFNRTDEGDVPPRAVIAGPHTGIIKIRQVVSTMSAATSSRRSRTTSRTTSSPTHARRRGTRTRPGSSASGASPTTATCRRAA